MAGLGAATAAAAPQTPVLEFQVQEGLNLNQFLRQGEVAAHLLLRSGSEPRILVAFPAGNSGVGVWFAHSAAAVSWTQTGVPQPVSTQDASGRPLFGVRAQTRLTGADLELREAVLSSIRVLRDYELLGTVPPQVAVGAPRSGARTLSWERDRLDGAAGYRLELEVTDGTLEGRRILRGPDGAIALTITGLSGEPPLTPLGGPELLNEQAAPDAAARHTLSFLAYREKLLAGSWRFDTYFGRDTLISLRLLLPVLSPGALDDGLSSVLARLSPQGEVAHEEDIGERAVLDHLATDGTRSAAPVYDYKMIDSSYLLAPVAAAWLLEDARARAHAAAYLAAPSGAAGPGQSHGAALLRNFRFVLERTRAFAADPAAPHLIALKSGFAVGDWRDSDSGLGGGRYPYDVNAVLVPAALEAIARFAASGLLRPYLERDDAQLLSRAQGFAARWRTQAPPLFALELPNEAAVRAIRSYSAAEGLTAQPALSALGTAPLQFHALALDAAYRAVPVMHSDEGFALLFGQLDATQLAQVIGPLMRPFPAGLMTGVGMVVANPAFAPAELQGRFTRNAYHGTVVWSWQQALFAAGLERQLRRTDLPPALRRELGAAQRTLWEGIRAGEAMRNSELWSWSFAAGAYRIQPFGAAAADADESNAAQLWSTVYLAVRPPPGRARDGPR